MTRPRSDRYEEGPKKQALGKFKQLTANLQLARYFKALSQKQKEEDAARKDPYWDKINAARQKASKRRRMKFRGPNASRYIPVGTGIRLGVIRKKQDFWILVPKLIVKDGVGQVVNYRAQVRGYPIVWQDVQREPVAGKRWKNVAYEYHMLCYRDTVGNWHVHEQTSGMPLSQGYTLEDASKKARIDYLAIQANCMKGYEGKNFAEVIAEKPEIESLPEISTREAMTIVTRRLNEKKAKREERRVASSHHRQKFDGITDLDSRADVQED